jgi:hypothetical protein
MHPRVIFEGGGSVRTMLNCGGTVWEVHSPYKLSASQLRFIQRNCARAQMRHGITFRDTLTSRDTLRIDRLRPR